MNPSVFFIMVRVTTHATNYYLGFKCIKQQRMYGQEGAYHSSQLTKTVKLIIFSKKGKTASKLKNKIYATGFFKDTYLTRYSNLPVFMLSDFLSRKQIFQSKRATQSNSPKRCLLFSLLL